MATLKRFIEASLVGDCRSVGAAACGDLRCATAVVLLQVKREMGLRHCSRFSPHARKDQRWWRCRFTLGLNLGTSGVTRAVYGGWQLVGAAGLPVGGVIAAVGTVVTVGVMFTLMRLRLRRRSGAAGLPVGSSIGEHPYVTA